MRDDDRALLWALDQAEVEDARKTAKKGAR